MPQEPVDWEFFGDLPPTTTSNIDHRIFAGGELVAKYTGRFRVETTVADEYTLVIDNVTRNEGGWYRCVDETGSGKDRQTAYISVTVRDGE